MQEYCNEKEKEISNTFKVAEEEKVDKSFFLIAYNIAVYNCVFYFRMHYIHVDIFLKQFIYYY